MTDTLENTEVDSTQQELESSRLECRRLNEQLAALVTQQTQKNTLIKNLKNGLKALEKKDRREEIVKGVGQLIRMIDLDASMDNNWDQISLYFDKANQDFLNRLSTKFPQLTPKDHKLCAYLRLNLSTKDIAPLMNISVRGVEISRYRLRKKLSLEHEQNLVEFLGKI